MSYLGLLRTGDIDAYYNFHQRESERFRIRQGPDGPIPGQTPIGVAHFWKGRWQEALATFDEVARREGVGTVFHGIGPAYVMLTKAYMGEREGALAVLRQKGQGTASGSQDRSTSTVAFEAHDTGRAEFGPRLQRTRGPDA